MQNIKEQFKEAKRLEKSKIRARKKDYNGAESEHNTVLTVKITLVCPH